MLDFISWCQSKSLPLPLQEKAMRNISQQYPDGYIGSQYPDAYFSPVVSTSYLDIKNRKSNNRNTSGQPKQAN